MARKIPFDILTAEAVEAEYPNLFKTFQDEIGLNALDAIIAVSIAVGVCKFCHNEESGCHCWNDE